MFIPEFRCQEATKRSQRVLVFDVLSLAGHAQTEFVGAYYNAQLQSLLDADGHIIDRIDLTCGDDESAARARELMDGHPVELWDGGRKIATFDGSGESPPA